MENKRWISKKNTKYKEARKEDTNGEVIIKVQEFADIKRYIV